MNQIVNNVSTLTTIAPKDIRNLLNKFIFCICDAVAESRIKEEEVTELDIGLGILYIKCSPDQIKYKFTPSSELEKAVNETVITKLNCLDGALERSLVNKISNLYKELL